MTHIFKVTKQNCNWHSKENDFREKNKPSKFHILQVKMCINWKPHCRYIYMQKSKNFCGPKQKKRRDRK